MAGRVKLGCQNLRDCSVVLNDVAVSPVEQVLIGVELVLEKAATQCLLDLALTRFGLLPARESHLANDLVDVSDDSLHNYRSVGGLDLLKQVG